MNKPTHVYIGRKPCGCVVTVITDMGDRSTANDVRDAIVAGKTIERVSFAEYIALVSIESNFMNCPHRPGQLPLEVNA